VLAALEQLVLALALVAQALALFRALSAGLVSRLLRLFLLQRPQSLQLSSRQALAVLLLHSWPHLLEPLRLELLLRQREALHLAQPQALQLLLQQLLLQQPPQRQPQGLN
jgi:hypothetical protein